MVVTILLTVLLVLLVVVATYVADPFIAYERLEDTINLEVSSVPAQPIETGREHYLTSYSICFDAYSNDFSFFMDGDRESRARSPEAVRENVGDALAASKAADPELLLLQKVNPDGTNSRKSQSTRKNGTSIRPDDAQRQALLLALWIATEKNFILRKLVAGGFFLPKWNICLHNLSFALHLMCVHGTIEALCKGGVFLGVSCQSSFALCFCGHFDRRSTWAIHLFPGESSAQEQSHRNGSEKN